MAQISGSEELARWSQIATIASAVATIAYVILTAAIVCVARKQASIATSQTTIADRQLVLAHEQTRIAVLQAELQAQQLVTSTTEALSAAAQDLHELWLQSNAFILNVAPGNTVQGKEGIQRFFAKYADFFQHRYPLLRAQIGDNYEELGGLVLLNRIVRDSGEKQRWMHLESFNRQYESIPVLLDKTVALIAHEQNRQAELLKEVRARRLASESNMGTATDRQAP